jgi:long-subunit acyl-CoA synthetase (AMP-forming)
VERYDLSSLELITCAAAPLGRESEAACSERLGCPAIQAYGMTEVSPGAAFTPVESASSPGVGGAGSRRHGVSVGPAGAGEDVADGERGELLIRGPQVMLAYLNNPTATAAMIDPDGWLHTGDKAQARPRVVLAATASAC